MKNKSTFLAGMRGELIAAGLVVLAVVGSVLGVRYADSYYHSRESGVVLTAQVSEKGGWEPRTIYARVGQPLKLRITSVDVTHGFLLPEFGIEAGLISPGEYVTVEFTPDHAGTFKFYCNVLCSMYHGAMNGVIVVEEADVGLRSGTQPEVLTYGE